MLAERRQGHARGPALVDQGGHPGAHAAQVGFQAEAAGHVLEDMGVGVDHPGDDQPAAHIDALAGLRRRAGREHGCHPAIADREVMRAVEALAGIDQMAAGEQQIEGSGVEGDGLRHGDAFLRNAARRCARRARAGAG